MPTRLSHESVSRLAGVVAAALLAALVAGCASQQAAQFAPTTVASVQGATITFDSIDGPPPEVFKKLVASLNEEAAARQIAVVPRQAAATFRVRGYVTALVDRDKTSFSWVWDVYDADKHRALRINGEEPAGAHRGKDAGKDAWTVADERVLRDISRAGMERIATFLATPGQAQPPVTEPLLPVLVSNRDDSPEAAGIFRTTAVSEPESTPQSEPPAEATSKAPAPSATPARRRPAAAAPATRSAAVTPAVLEQ
ncbi:hypothetical protein [Rhodoplanes sp. Z2-YC6860]|uniref:hypothetical protein n=1 Tax=Rhodoplanes sp. Z2-YC6860 TaxID=674703 RepID=UPI0012EE9B13|nr:hypothetical protein [Rhodoplanes sp. Z2-YC6860]